MGEVYLASLVGELGFEKRLVIKTILPELAAKPRFVEMFAAEAKTAVSLSHGNIARSTSWGRPTTPCTSSWATSTDPRSERMLKAYRKRDEPPEVGLALFLMAGGADRPGVRAHRGSGAPRGGASRHLAAQRAGRSQRSGADRGLRDRGASQRRVAGARRLHRLHGARAGRGPSSPDPRADVFSTACMVVRAADAAAGVSQEGRVGGTGHERAARRAERRAAAGAVPRPAAATGGCGSVRDGAGSRVRPVCRHAHRHGAGRPPA